MKRKKPFHYTYNISNEALKENLRLTPEEKMAFLTRALRFTWEASDKKTRKILFTNWHNEL